jgi:bifunctional DNA-binding transcriptional regulator/antitoxin component of YhaV-PrlF toxin-antitoxin module
MKIEIEKKLVNDEIIKTEELIFTIPKAIYDELDWEEGTVVEWDITKQENEDVDNNKVRILLRNIDDKILD